MTTSTLSRPAVETIKADTRTVLREYCALQARAPREAGDLYLRELSGRIGAGENLIRSAPVSASNALGTLATSMVAQRSLELVFSKRPMLRGVVTDFSDELANLNDTITTRYPGALPTVKALNSTPSETDDTDAPVVLDQLVEAKYTYTAAEVASTSRDLVVEHAEALAVSMGNAIADSLAALITEVNFGATSATQTVKAAAAVDFSTLASINRAMNDADLPDTYRFGWVNTDVAESLENDSLLTSYLDRSPSPSAYAHWRGVRGFSDVWEFPALPANTINLIGFFALRSALIVSARLPQNPESMRPGLYRGKIVPIVDPVTGLSLLLDQYGDTNWNVISRVVSLYGVAVGNPAAGHTLVSAA